MVTSLVQCYYPIMLLRWTQNLDMMLLSGIANCCECLKSFSEHLQPLCCPNSPRNTNALHYFVLSDGHPFPEPSGSSDPVPRCARPYGHVGSSDGRVRLSVVSGIYRRGAVPRLQSKPIFLHSQDLPILSWSH